MRLRDGCIIVCDCGSELNPEITTPQDFIKYVDGVATCSNCGENGEITFLDTGDIVIPQGPSLEDRITAMEDIIMELLV